MSKKKSGKVTAEVYQQIKTLKEVGKLKHVVIAKIVGTHQTTVGRVCRSADYEAYKQFVRNQAATVRAKKRPAAVAELSEPTIVPINDPTTDLITLMENVYARLESIESSVKWIEDHIEVKSSKSWLSRS